MVISKVISFSLIYLLSNTPLYGASSLEAKINSMREQQKISKPLKISPNEAKLIENQSGEFYAKEIVQPGTDYVVNPDNALGEPDNNYAEIMPDGELTIKMEKPFQPISWYTDGRVVVKEEANYSLAAWVPILSTDPEYPLIYGQDVQGVKYVWREIIPGAVPGGFEIPGAPQSRIDTIKIKNLGQEAIYIDAIIGYGNAE